MRNADATSRAPTEFYARLQSLRGLGVLMVAFFHCQGVLGGELPTRPVPGRGQEVVHILGHYVSLALLNGHGALMTFFVLSGFVLTLSLRRGPQDLWPASLAFGVNRFWRIIPANAVAVLAALVLLDICGAAPQARVPPPWDWSQVVTNMLLFETTINPVAWSLVVEVLAVPFIVGLYFLNRRYGLRALLVATALALVLSFSPRHAGYVPFGRNLFAFCFGMLVAELAPRVAGSIERRPAVIWFSGALFCFVVARGLLGRWSHWPSLIEAGAASIMIGLIASGPALSGYRVLEWRPLLWLGEISFSLYLYHALLWPWLAPPANAAVFVRLGGWGPLAALFVTTIVTVVATLPVAWLAYRTVERGGIALGHWCARQVRAAPRPVAVGVEGVEHG